MCWRTRKTWSAAWIYTLIMDLLTDSTDIIRLCNVHIYHESVDKLERHDQTARMYSLLMGLLTKSTHDRTAHIYTLIMAMLSISEDIIRLRVCRRHLWICWQTLKPLSDCADVKTYQRSVGEFQRHDRISLQIIDLLVNSEDSIRIHGCTR